MNEQKNLLHTLLVEDDLIVAATLVEALEAYGFQVTHVDNAEACFAAFSRAEPALVLMDLELPGLMGHEICKALRDKNFKRTPIIALSGCQDDDAIVKMLEAGADDFVAKSQALPILIAHIRAVLNRGKRLTEVAVPTKILSWGPIQFDKTTRRIWLMEKELALTPTELGMLEIFISAPGAVFTRGQLIDKLHGAGHAITQRTIDVHINGLRNNLGSYKNYLQTVRGVGYRFAESSESASLSPH